MNNFYINKAWKDIANGHTVFCVFGGPSSKQVNDIHNIIKNNFTVTVNHNIKDYPNCDLYITADNGLAREYFEDKEFFLHKYIRSHLFSKNQWVGEYSEDKTWIKGKRDLLLQHPNQTRIIACNDFPSYNHSWTVGQLYKGYGEQFCKEVPNTYLCIEHRDINGESYPILSPNMPESIETYGADPLKLLPGGNISGVVFQLLWFMGFDKVIIVGYGDDGISNGYNNNEKFTWSNEEIHAMVVHNTIWQDKLKSLHGAEICREYCNFPQASYDELEITPEKKNKLVNKLLNLK
jgi:hypothetical protein